MEPTDFKAPRQERSRRTLRRLLDATRTLLEERPFVELSVGDITDEAGLSRGAFYRRFDGKEALLHHLNSRLYEGALESWTDFLAPERWEGVPVARLLDALVERTTLVYQRQRHLMRAFAHEVRWSDDPEIQARADWLDGHIEDLFVEALAGAECPVGPRDAEDVAPFMLRVVQSVLAEALLWSEPPATGDELVRTHKHLMTMLLAYVEAGR